MSATIPKETLDGGSTASGCSPSGRTHLDLFSGIGGFALAAQAAGYSTIGFSEIEPYACKILKCHWPDVPNLGDIRNVRGIRADLVTGGFPCQPFSLAGERRGAADDRALWPEMCRVIEEAQPAWVLGENVPGIISLGLDDVLSDLERIGYSAWPIVIPACAVGAPQHRERVWICAHSERKRLQRHISLEGSSGCPKSSHAKSDNRVPQSWDALARHCGGLRGGYGLSVGMVRSEVKAYGNAIVPKVAETLLRMIARMENDKLTDRE